MWPSIRDGFVNFFTNKTYFASLWDKWVAKVRAALMLLGAGIAIPGGFGDQLKAVIPAKYQALAGIALMGASLLLRAGDKTPDNVKALANGTPPAQP